MNERFVGVFHLFIANKMYHKCDKRHNYIIKREVARMVLYNNNIPKLLHNKFIKEMEDYGLIKSKNKRNLILKNFEVYR